jgi:hypothetical protein
MELSIDKSGLQFQSEVKEKMKWEESFTKKTVTLWMVRKKYSGGGTKRKSDM